MNAIHKLAGTLAVVSMLFAAPVAYSQAQKPVTSKAAQFRSLEAEMQRDSTNMPSASAPVDKSAPATDPIPKATSKAQKKARFAAQERAMQNDSLSSPYGSPPVSKSTSAVDPVAKAATKAEKKKRFANEEKQWQEESTP